MVKALYIIRHGQTEGATGEPRYKGIMDVPLSEEGFRQAERTAAYMKQSGRTPERIYCSTLSRARRSAEALTKAFGIAAMPHAGLRERSFGRWEGMSFDEIRAIDPEAFSLWAQNPLTHSPVGGESTLEVRDRVMGAMDEIMSDGGAERIAIVAHGGVNRVLLCHYMALPLEHIFRIEQHFACLNVISIHDGFPVVDLLNWHE